MVDGITHVHTKYEQSEEQARIYFEKWQQQKSKKTNKRQRDSSNVQAVSALVYHPPYVSRRLPLCDLHAAVSTSCSPSHSP